MLTGNTVIDALLEVAAKPYVPADPVPARAILDDPRRMLLVTTHRRENWGEPMARIGEAVRQIVEAFPGCRRRRPLASEPAGSRQALTPALAHHPRVHLIEPQEYVPFVKLEQKAALILTDSGGVQEEAPSLGKPVLVARETTERPEGVAAGTAKLVGTDTALIVAEASRLLSDPEAYAAMARAVSPYGDGHAARANCRGPGTLFEPTRRPIFDR